MLTIKAGRPAVEFVKLCYRANRPPLFEGYHGIGKSELMRQAAAELSIGFISRDLALMEPPDLVGLPKMAGDTTKYLPPDFLPKDGKGILTFEELNRAEKYVRSPCLELLTSRRLNDFTLPPGWLPAACINPATADYDVSDLDPALLSRFIRARLVADRDEWLTWARENRVHSAVIDYVENDSTVFAKRESNPRSWAYVSDLLRANEHEPTTPDILLAAIVGAVGPRRGAAFMAVLKGSVRPLSAATILESYGRHQRHVQDWVSNGKLDVVKATLLALEKHLQPKNDFQEIKADAAQWKSLALFLHDLPGDLLEEAKKFFAERKYPFPKRPRM